jgi:hypothetical protein
MYLYSIQDFDQKVNTSAAGPTINNHITQPGAHVRTYIVDHSRVERVWTFAQSYNLPMYRKRIQMMGHTYIEYVIEVPDTEISTSLLLAYSEYLQLV